MMRFSNLASLPPWTDECATIAFSLGNSFLTVPLNEIVSANVILQPLQSNTGAGIGSVAEHLSNESTHPPLYFFLTHLWMKVFSPPQELASISAARSLSALFGVFSIPALFSCGYFVFRSLAIAQMAAAMMAVSPYAIFLARQARHYTLASLLAIASLYCFLKAIEIIQNRRAFPIWMMSAWIVINCLGIATHYFFVLTLCTQALVLLLHILRQIQKGKFVELQPYWWPIGLVAVGTLIGCLVWLPALYGIYGSEPTNWVADGNPRTDWFGPVGRLLIWLVSVFLLLPSAFTHLSLTIVIVSGAVSLLFLMWSLPHLLSGLKTQQQNPNDRLAIQILVEYVVVAIALILGITYGLGMDLTLAARFQFFIAPAIVLLLAAALAGIWQYPEKLYSAKKQLSPIGNGAVRVAIIYFMATLGSFTAVDNLGYLQNHRPDLLAPIIQANSQDPALIATTHKHHGQTGRMMGLAWEFKHFSDSQAPGKDWTFFLAHRDPETKTYTSAIQAFQQQLAQLPRPFDLWLVDFRAGIDLQPQQCLPDDRGRQSAGEYRYQQYRCQTTN
ncbi:glycosyltransferase family 39 protein [Synechococcus sp. PCC 7336]|uniref:glycosyltransferase family 39 protein n=1 Tax=Synechococcus sp. PCC 7336 TaxID=195250 RepID=UPI00037D96C3|nr:glycosyltransferase family 39 protein [Synechococcus sp. PCC 7336]